ncbi:MAG: hypothetical protein IPP94_10390 [Ignavibacteria bacterium]|nr:hypothetical protein [Ignavibacteria bacterium]
MKRGALLILFTLLAAAVPAQAQLQYAIGNFFRYGNGNQHAGGQSSRKEYVENQTNVRLFWNDVTVGFQYQYDDPPEFGPKYQGIKKRYVEYQRDGLQLTAGDFYTLFGKGLAMNLFENRGINYDTKLDGLRGVFQNRELHVITAVGTMKYYDLVNPDRIETYSVRSGFVELTPASFVRVGASLVGVSGDSPNAPYVDQVNADILSAMASFKVVGFDVYGEYASKHSFGMQQTGPDRYAGFDRTGDAIYGNISYSGAGGFGASVEYKNYRYDVVNTQQRDPNRPTRMLPMANPPTAFKEHSFNLLARKPHVIDFNDEVGWQIDAFYSVSPELTLALNGSAASRQKSWLKLPGGSFREIRKTNDLFPAMDEEFSPFYEVYAEAEWYFDGQSYVRAAVARRFDAPYEEITREAHEQSSFTIPVRIEYMLTEEYSLGVSLEQQRFHDSSYPEGEQDLWNEFVSVTFAKAPLWAATVRAEFTTDEFEPSGKKFWMAGEFSYRLGNAHTATVSYGSERGGLICSNGICRQVNPFDGVRFQLVTQL